jgi:hypothetical protein
LADGPHDEAISGSLMETQRFQLQQLTSTVWIMVLYAGFYGAGLALWVFSRDILRVPGGENLYIIQDMTRVLSTLAVLFLGLLIGEWAASLLIRTYPRSKSETFQLPSDGSMVIAMIFASLLLILEIVRVGPIALFDREEYIQNHLETNSLGAIGWFTLAAPAICGIHAAKHVGFPSRLIQWFLLALFCFLQFGNASKKLSVGLALYFLSFYLLSGRRLRWFHLALIGTLLVGTYNFVLSARGLPQHGVLNYVREYRETLAAIFDMEPLLKTLGDSLTVFDETLVVYDFASWSQLWMNLNPLPGKLTGWYETFPLLRLNSSSPFCAVGELGSFGLLTTFLFYLNLGGIASLIDRFMQRHGTSMTVIWGVRLVFLCFALFSMQYNLRAAFRFAYMAFFLAGASLLFFRRSEASEDPESQSLDEHGVPE